MTLRFPYPIVHAEEENRFQCEAEPRLDNIKRKKMQNSTHFSSRRSLVKVTVYVVYISSLPFRNLSGDK